MDNTLLAILKLAILTTVSFLLAWGLAPILVRLLKSQAVKKQIRNSEQAPVFAALHAGKAGTPTSGGILVWGTVFLVIMVIHALARTFDQVFSWLDFLTRRETWLPLGVIVASGLAGLVDDWFNTRRWGVNGGGLRMRTKFLIMMAIAAVGAWWFYGKLGVDTLHVPFVGDVVFGWWYIPFFMLVLVATTNAVNITDGLDGLAGGTLLAAFGAYGAIAFAQGRVNLAAFCGVIIGALLAFLWSNIYPARWFMGDTGSLALGTTLGVIAMLTDAALLLPFIGIIFVVETGSVLLQWGSRRFWKRKLLRSAPLHHHLESIGWPEPTIVFRFWIIAGIAAVVGLILALLDKTF